MVRTVREITSRAEAAIQILAQQFNVSIHDWSLYTFWLIITWYKCYNIGTIIEKLISILTHNNIVLSLDCLQSVFSLKIRWAGAKAFPPSHLPSFVDKILSVIYLKKVKLNMLYHLNVFLLLFSSFSPYILTHRAWKSRQRSKWSYLATA